jgi:uncharacterized small protein (DUF1192 family)
MAKDRIVFDPGKSNLTTEGLGVDDIEVTSKEGSQQGLESIDTAINSINELRARIGASQNRLQTTINSQQIYSKHQPRFDQHTIAEPNGDSILIHVLANGFWGQIIQDYPGNTIKKIFWKQTDLLPTNAKEKHIHQNVSTASFGENPNLPTVGIFGRSAEIARIEFLGHQDILVADVMASQEAEYLPELSVSYASPDSVHKGVIQRREIILTTPVMHTQVVNTTEQSKTRKKEEYKYPARVMVFLEKKERIFEEEDKHEHVRHKEPSALRIGVGILADADDKLRVYYCRSRSISLSKKQQKTDMLLQFLDGVFSYGEQALQEINVLDVQNWEPRELNDDQIEFLSPEVARLRPTLSNKKKTRKKK